MIKKPLPQFEPVSIRFERQEIDFATLVEATTADYFNIMAQSSTFRVSEDIQIPVQMSQTNWSDNGHRSHL
jgi:hypothetical protein